MVVPFISHDDDADDDIKSISGTCSSRECILSISIRQGLNIEYSLNTVPFQSIRPTRDFPTFLKNLRKSEKSKKNYFRGQKKMGVTRDGRIDRNGTVLY
jgi:hypothetical protein